MENLFLTYPKCSTCAKAKHWLQENKIAFVERHIVENHPTEEELTQWITHSGVDVKRFFNTSGMVYRQKGLKDKLPSMSNEEKIRLLAEDGMLVKRPLLIGKEFILIGFKEDEWKQLLD